MHLMYQQHIYIAKIPPSNVEYTMKENLCTDFAEDLLVQSMILFYFLIFDSLERLVTYSCFFLHVTHLSWSAGDISLPLEKQRHHKFLICCDCIFTTWMHMNTKVNKVVVMSGKLKSPEFLTGPVSVIYSKPSYLYKIQLYCTIMIECIMIWSAMAS